MRTLRNVDIKGLRVLLRVDYNVPLDENGDIVDDFKIKKSLPTLKHLLKDAKQVIIMSHLGRPKGKYDKRFVMDKVAIKLMRYVGREVAKLDDCIDVEIPPNKVVLLENLRFHKEEEKNDPEFSKKLARNADFYVNDAFAVSHRTHASVVGITKYLPSCAGLLLEEEVRNLNFSNPIRPFTVIMGGSKLSTKFPIINTLLPKVDNLLLGGAMIFTFYKSDGLEIGKSLCEDDYLMAAKLLKNNEKIVLPEDIVVAKEIDKEAKSKTVAFNKIPKEWIGLDVGDKSIEKFKDVLKKSKTIFWNGPIGYYEIDIFAKGTFELAKFLAKLGVDVIIGGGDSAAFVQELGLVDQFKHVSTGGGASLEYIQKGTLPGIEVLKS